MQTRWTSHLKDPVQKEAFERDIRSARNVLERLQQMIEEDEASVTTKEINPSSYSVPNWSHLMAHNNGIRQYMCQIKTLINLDDRKDKV